MRDWGLSMFSFKRTPKLTEQKVKNLVQELEATYIRKDIEKLTLLFHPNHRNISFLNHFTLMMNFQIYSIESGIMNVDIIHLTKDVATFTYTRKHMYTCIEKEDENGDNPNNITSFYVNVSVEGQTIWINRLSKYSEVFLDELGNILPNEMAVVPPNAQFFVYMKRYIESFQLNDLKPATYLVYSDSEFIGYYPENERFSFSTTEKFTVDYFSEMTASSIKEHTDLYIGENVLVSSEIIKMEEHCSIIETQFIKDSSLQHELVLSIIDNEGFYMIRYLKNTNTPLDSQKRLDWIDQMIKATHLN